MKYNIGSEVRYMKSGSEHVWKGKIRSIRTCGYDISYDINGDLIPEADVQAIVSEPYDSSKDFNNLDVNREAFYRVFEEMTGKSPEISNCQMLSMILDELSALRAKNDSK